jgi:hypothetical protein
MFWTQKTRALARDEGLLIEHLNDETVVFDTKSRQAHCLGPLAATVFAHADGRTSNEGLAGIASERLGETVVLWQIDDALSELQAAGLLAIAAPRSHDGSTRRQVLKKGAITGGVVFAAPLITSVVPPASAAGGSATCGAVPGEPGPTVLCCPCTTESRANKDECCQPPFTNKCNCTSAQGDSTKFCHPVGQASGHDATCTVTTGAPPCSQCCANQTAAGCGPLKSNTSGNWPGTGVPATDPTAPNCTGPCPAAADCQSRCT